MSKRESVFENKKLLYEWDWEENQREGFTPQNITMGSRKKCIVFSLEMQKTELAERLLSSQAGVESQKLKTGELTDEEWVRLGNAAATYNDVELYLDDTSAITVPEIKSRVRRMRGVDCIIIDYLGLISSAT